MAEGLGTRGEFRLLHKIGEGGMADVFLAERMGDDGFRTRVALKRLHRGLAMDSYFIRQLVREARLLGQLEHNNIVKVFDLRRIGDEYYVVMEYVDGIDLAAVIKVHRSRKTRIPRPFFFHVALSLTEALAYAHNAVDPAGNPTPLIHRDIKPSNVMLSRRGIVKLTDFGIAHVGDGSVTGGLVQGTANYMSPEQAFGEDRLTSGSDIYSLGSVFYEMLTGRPLIDGDNYLKAIHQVRERRVPVEELAQLGVEPGLRVVIAKMLSPVASSRYAEMDNVRNDLQFVADRLKIDLSWHRIRAYVGRLMGILGRAPGRVTLSNVGPAALMESGALKQLGPGAPTPAPAPPLPEPLTSPPTSQPLGVGPSTPATPVPQQRLERSGPVTQAVQKDILDSYIAIAQLEAASDQGVLPSATAQGLVALDDNPTGADRGAGRSTPPASVRPRRDPLDAQTMAGPPPPMKADFSVGTSIVSRPPQAPVMVPPTAPAPDDPHSLRNPAPASAWDDTSRTRVYAGPTPAEKGVFGVGVVSMPGVTGSDLDADRTRPLPPGIASRSTGGGRAPLPDSSLPTPPLPVPAVAAPRSGKEDLNDPTRLYAGRPSQTSAGMRAIQGVTEDRPAAPTQSTEARPLSSPPRRSRKPKRDGQGKKRSPTRRRGGSGKQRGRGRKRGVHPALIGSLVMLILVCACVITLLLLKKLQ